MIKRKTLDSKQAQRKIKSIGVEDVYMTDKTVNIKLKDGSKLKISVYVDSIESVNISLNTLWLREVDMHA